MDKPTQGKLNAMLDAIANGERELRDLHNALAKVTSDTPANAVQHLRGTLERVAKTQLSVTESLLQAYRDAGFEV